MSRVPVHAGEDVSSLLRYEAGVTFFGRVTDQNLGPVTLAKVRVNGFKDEHKRLPFVQTDPSGNYRQEPATGTDFNVSVNAEGYYLGRARVKDLAPGVREHRVDISLERAPLLRGRLARRRLAGARIRAPEGSLWDGVEPAGPSSDRAAPRRIRGSAQRSELPIPRPRRGPRAAGEDAYELTPESKGIKYLSLWLHNDLLGLAELKSPEVAPDIVVDWSKVPPPKPRGSLEILVRSQSDRAPVTDYHVRIVGPRDAPMLEQSDSGQHSTASDGHVRFVQVVEGRYDVKITATGFDDLKTSVVLKSVPDVTEVVVDLVPIEMSPATASVIGTVRGPNGAPINGATVWLVPERAERSGDAKRGETNAEGAFRFEKLLPDSYLVIAEAPRPSRLAPAWTRAIAPASDGVVVSLAEGVEVRFVPDGTIGPLSFRILDSAGVAVVDGLRSQMRRWGGMHAMVLAPGRYEIQASCPGFTSARASFVATEGASIALKFEREPK